ncbi:hypothetical protein [Roseomonas indoligenes]|uniref:Uncharacterized protein n=1 Tax=Roseomonas indoligenes TaxID=2820811 RepID=A0A940MU83_9PROT|nr:hypothetical protein [Pararoseomonas indoligenes]MBP0492066.1 hypothetical protein [Pararoseomonas indoligenes]
MTGWRDSVVVGAGMVSWFGYSLLLGGLPVIVANMAPPSPLFGDEPMRAAFRILIGMAVSSAGVVLLD